jgi:hypothetical protein
MGDFAKFRLNRLNATEPHFWQKLTHRPVDFANGSDGSKGDEQPGRPSRPQFLKKPILRPPCKSQEKCAAMKRLRWNQPRLRSINDLRD